VQLSPTANTDEQVTTRKRRELLSELKDIIEEKKKNNSDVDAEAMEDPFSPPRKVRLKFRGGARKTCGDSSELNTPVTDTNSSAASVRTLYPSSRNSGQHKKKNDDDVDVDAMDQFTDTLAASSSGKQQIHKASSQNTAPTPSSVACRRNSQTKQKAKYKVESVVEEADLCDKVNPLSARELHTESDRNSSMSSNFKQHRPLSEDAAEKPLLHITTSKHHLQPLIPRGIKRKFSVNDKTVSGACANSESKNKHGVHARYLEETTVVCDPSQPSRKVTIATDCGTESSNEALCCKLSDQQDPGNKRLELHPASSIQEQESRVVVLQTDVKEPLLVVTAETEHLGDIEDSFVLSPPREVRLKFRGGASKKCRELNTPSLTYTTVSTASNRSSCSPSPNCEQHKQPSEDVAETEARCTETESKPPVPGHSLSTSKHRSQPLMPQSPKRKFLDARTSVLGCYENNASENERVISKNGKEPLVHLSAQSGLYSRPDRNDRCHSRDQRTFSQSSAKGCHDEKLKRVEKSSDVLQEQHTGSLRFERECGFKIESSWQQEEVSWQETDSTTWLEKNTQLKRKYHNRHKEQLQEQRTSDLRQKLNARRQYMNRHYGDEEAYGQDLFDDQPVNHFGEARQCLLRAPPSQRCCDDVSEEFDIDHELCHDSQRHQSRGIVGDFSVSRQDDTLLQVGDEDLRMTVDHRHWKQSWEHSTSSVEEEPDHNWHREVRLYYRVRQLYKNISMLFLFPVKDGKLSTGFNVTFDASCYS